MNPNLQTSDSDNGLSSFSEWRSLFLRCRKHKKRAFLMKYKSPATLATVAVSRLQPVKYICKANFRIKKDRVFESLCTSAISFLYNSLRKPEIKNSSLEALLIKGYKEVQKSSISHF